MKIFSERNAEAGMTSILILCGLIFLFCIFPGCKAFFSDYQGVFTFFGFFVAIIAVFFTWLQIKATKNQIKATFVYQVQKDSEELIAGIDPDVLKYIQEAPKTEIQKQDETELKKTMSKIFRYYASLEKQNQYGIIDQKEWEVIVNNFCAFLNKPIVMEHWNEQVRDNPSWSPGFKSFGETCFQEEGDKK